MKDRRGFLKLLGIGAGAVAAGVLAVVAGTPTPAPRTIQDIEKIKPYIGPDGVPGGDYIKERPPVVPVPIKVPELTPDQHQWIVDGTKRITFDPVLPLKEYKFNDGVIDMSSIDWDDAHVAPGALIPTTEVVTTTGTYDHNLGGYSLENTWTNEVDFEG